MMQQQELRREIAVLKSLHTSQFDRIAEDIEMLSSTNCAIKKRLENIENQSEGAQIEMAMLKEESKTLKNRRQTRQKME